jgi:hypothetical protein
VDESQSARSANRPAFKEKIALEKQNQKLFDATPFGLNPGEEDGFLGPCSGTSEIQSPNINWIHWD